MGASAFPFLLVMFAVLIGMGVVRLVTAIAMFLRDPAVHRFYWVHFAWLGFTLLLYLHVWWSLWEFRNSGTWTYFTYLFMLVGPIVLFVATTVLIPDPDGTTGSDGRTIYYSVHRQFFGALAVAVVWGMLLHPVLLGEPDPVLVWLVLFLGVVVTLAVTPRPAVHAVLTVAAWVLFIIWVISYGFSLEAI
jgi:hypothetical protein